jgi:hypothetical protein
MPLRPATGKKGGRDRPEEGLSRRTIGGGQPLRSRFHQQLPPSRAGGLAARSGVSSPAVEPGQLLRSQDFPHVGTESGGSDHDLFVGRRDAIGLRGECGFVEGRRGDQVTQRGALGPGLVAQRPEHRLMHLHDVFECLALFGGKVHFASQCATHPLVMGRVAGCRFIRADGNGREEATGEGGHEK